MQIIFYYRKKKSYIQEEKPRHQKVTKENERKRKWFWYYIYVYPNKLLNTEVPLCHLIRWLFSRFYGVVSKISYFCCLNNHANFLRLRKRNFYFFIFNYIIFVE